MKETIFSISEENRIHGSEIILKNILTNEFVSILPNSGARVKELYLFNGETIVSLVKKIENVDSRGRDDIFTNAKLAPFAGRIEGGKYLYEAKTYHLEKNYEEENNACHGFVYDKNFRITKKTINENFAACSLEYVYNGDVPGYPFPFNLEIMYKLTANDGFICTTKIKNESHAQIPLNDGWHFYFDLGTKVDDLKLKIDSCEINELGSQMIPTGVSKPFHEFSSLQTIGNRQFDSCFKLSGNEKAVTRLLSESMKIDLRIWQETGPGKYGFLVLYTPPDRKTIAVEQMTSNINSFNNGEGLISLAPDEVFTSSFGISLNKNI